MLTSLTPWIGATAAAIALATGAVLPMQPATPSAPRSACTEISGHSLCGIVRDKYINELHGPTGPLGSPVSGAIPNTGTYARFGAQRIDFESGVLYLDGSTVNVGTWMPMGSPAASWAAAPLHSSAKARPLERAACPAGTGNYAATQAPFNCVTNFVDPTGYLLGLRQGTTTKGTNAANGQSYSPFGREKYWQKHRLEDRWVELIVQDVAPVAEPDRDPESSPGVSYRQEFEFVQGENFMINNTIVTGLRVGEYRGPVLASPDTFDFGILTAYCVDGMGGFVAQCPAELPSPFLRQYPYGVKPTPPFA